MDAVEIGAALPSASDYDETHFFQFRNIPTCAAQAVAHIFCQMFLAGKAFIQFMRVFEQHGVSEFCTNGNLFALEYEVGNACPAALRGNVGTLQAEVAIFDCGGFPKTLHKAKSSSNESISYYRESNCMSIRPVHL